MRHDIPQLIMSLTLVSTGGVSSLFSTQSASQHIPFPIPIASAIGCIPMNIKAARNVAQNQREARGH